VPEEPRGKRVSHPWSAAQRSAATRSFLCDSEGTGALDVSGAGGDVGGRTRTSARYVELSVTSNFTFLKGASHPEELVARAADLGHSAVAITDEQTLGGIVRGARRGGRAGDPARGRCLGCVHGS
jgi:hypothetical protein